MTLDNAVSELEHFASDEDPIRYHRRDTTARDLLYELPPRTNVASFRIDYYGAEGWVKGGTMTGMIRDRRKLLGRGPDDADQD